MALTDTQTVCGDMETSIEPIELPSWTPPDPLPNPFFVDNRHAFGMHWAMKQHGLIVRSMAATSASADRQAGWMVGWIGR